MEPRKLTVDFRRDRFMTLLEPQYGRLNQYIRGVIRDTDEARDVLGETLLLTYEQFDMIDGDDGFRFYLFRVAQRVCRRWQRRKRIFLPWRHQYEELPLSDPPPDAQADLSIILDALEVLPFKLRETFIMFIISGLSLAEIRDLQGGTLSRVKSRIAAAKKRLASVLTDDHSSPTSNSNALAVNDEVQP
jgi:RNA polymerase sigma factor (sigma-70 family)